MPRLAKFLEKYDTVLFDMDGVITTEQMYWNTAALTVFEMLHSNKYYGKEDFDVKKASEDMWKIRKEVFLDDKIISFVKESGVNSNWDLVYLVLGSAIILETDNDFEKIYNYLLSLDNSTVFKLFDELAHRLSEKTGWELTYCTRLFDFWNRCTLVFQEWYLGSELYEKTLNLKPYESKKDGLSTKEDPLFPMDKLLTLLTLLNKSGKRIGIGSGRPGIELDGPLDSWDIRKYFTQDAIIDYTFLSETEKKLNLAERNINLVKPHPYMFLKGIFGRDYDDEKILSGDFDKEKCKKTLVVGDAGADMFAAFAAGCDFAAVLTGITGNRARDFFENENATYILNDVTFLMEEDNEN